MALSDYRGESPTGRDLTVVRVAPRHIWKSGGTATTRCEQTGEALTTKKHLVVEFESGEGRIRKYFRDERSFRAWLSDE